MRIPSAVSLFLIVALALGRPDRGAAADKGSAHDRPRPVAVKVVVDTSEVPELAGWGRKARDLVQKWYPAIGDLLRSDGFTPPAEVHIVFKKDMRGVAYTRGTTIVIAAGWVKRHPDDYGLVVHETTHVVQAYRRFAPSWLVEGIADYVRFYRYEPGTKLAVNPRRASYRDGYRTAAMFLAWVEKTHGPGIVRKLNEALRTGKYQDQLFRTYTSKTLDELWDAFVRSLSRERVVPR